jgi:hypothetical protein
MPSCVNSHKMHFKNIWIPVCKRLGKCVSGVKERSVWLLHPYSQFYHECGMLNPFLLLTLFYHECGMLNPFLSTLFYHPWVRGCLTLYFSQLCSCMCVGILNPFLLSTLFYHECGDSYPFLSLNPVLPWVRGSLFSQPCSTMSARKLNPFLLSTLFYHECEEA